VTDEATTDPATPRNTESLARELGTIFDDFDGQMQKLTADLDPDNVRTAGAMTLAVGMYANNLAKVLNELIGIVHRLERAQPDPVLSTGQPGPSRPLVGGVSKDRGHEQHHGEDRPRDP